MICIIDEDSLQSKVYQTDLTVEDRRVKSVELAMKLAKENNPEFKGEVQLANRCDQKDMTIVSFKRLYKNGR